MFVSKLTLLHICKEWKYINPCKCAPSKNSILVVKCKWNIALKNPNKLVKDLLFADLVFVILTICWPEKMGKPQIPRKILSILVLNCGFGIFGTRKRCKRAKSADRQKVTLPLVYQTAYVRTERKLVLKNAEVFFRPWYNFAHLLRDMFSPLRLQIIKFNVYNTPRGL